MLSPATAHLNGAMNLSLGCPSHRLENLFTRISGYATDLKLNLCNFIPAARSEAPNLATPGSADADRTSPERSHPLGRLRAPVFISSP